LSKIKKIDWAIHWVSMLHAVGITVAASFILNDPEMSADRIFAYNPYAGNVYAVACGYFLWDSIICLSYIRHFGPGFAVHGVACFIVFIFSFRPFLMYYGAGFLMFELSTPFLNIHWFCDKTGRTGSTLQLINGIVLLVVFFFARICLGFYNSADFYVNVYRRRAEIPTELIVTYSIANLLLNGLNVMWFSKMLTSVVSRFRKPGRKGKGKVQKAE
ncbi:TRAM/LAG1/CLN8 homology domain-containing protein, partial [Blyttiomyces helicus]